MLRVCFLAATNVESLQAMYVVHFVCTLLYFTVLRRHARYDFCFLHRIVTYYVTLGALV